MSIHEANMIMVKLDRLNGQHSQLRDAVLILQQMQPKMQQSEISSLQDELAQRQELVSESVRQQIELSRELTQQEASTANLRQEIAEVEQQLTSTQAALENEQLALDEALEEQSELLKLPQVETVAKSNVIILMRYGKAYIAYQGDGITPNGVHVTVTPLGASSKIAPNSTAGWDLNSTADISELEEYLDQYSSDFTILSVAVWPDSFKDFSQLQRLALKKGFQYQLWPLTDVPALLVSPSDQLPRVQ
jgi:phage host-nuclease inhibitor protein Gam